MFGQLHKPCPIGEKYFAEERHEQTLSESKEWRTDLE